MSFHIKELILDGADFSKYSVERGNSSLPNLSKINVFVGANNSGKSRFLRQIATIETLVFVPTVDLSAAEQIRKDVADGIKVVATRHRISDAGNFVNESQGIRSLLPVRENERIIEPLQQLVTKVLAQGTNGLTVTSSTISADHEAILRDLKAAVSAASASLEGAIKAIPNHFKFKRIYLPTLRGLRSLESGDRYEKRTREDYFPKASHVEIFTGLTLYEQIKQLLLGTLEQRETVAAFQNFLSAAFFEGQPVALIPKYDQDVLDVKIGDEAQRPIYILGDGIQAIITLTFPLFQYQDVDLLVFIEEPELFMHPGLQRLFVNVLLKFPRAQYFLATHSNHLLDLTLDVEQMAVFTFRKDLTGEGQREKDAHITIENVSNEDERSLQLLGIQNSSVFLSNSTIWVEGITDRRYVSHYLDLYQNHLRDESEANSLSVPRRYRQDLHYSFVEYAGANITHFSFLEAESDAIVVDRLCAKLFLLTDKDDEKKGGKEERHAALKEKLKERYFCLECREIENLLTPAVISAVIKTYEGADAELKPFDQNDYRDKPLGKFIEDSVLSSKKRRGSYQDKSGTISDKVTFCQRALENLRRYDDLSPAAKVLTETIYKFIQSRNS
jgi:hypothetical protein